VFLNHKPGWQPELDSIPSEKRKRGLWISGSALAHAIFLLVWCWPAPPGFVRPIWLAHGENGSGTPVSVALYLPQDIRVAERPLLSLPAAARPQHAKAKLHKRANVLDQDKPEDRAEAGSTSGTSMYGATEGDEIKPGFAVRFTDPRVARWQMPSGIQGDVIVELTIDTQGNVVEEKLLQGLGHGIDELVISTLRDWHFRPATRNGVAIPFKYDAHFHFPS